MRVDSYSPAVQTAKTICSESKKRNMTRSDIEAPIGKNIAWQVSIVCTSEKKKIKIQTNGLHRRISNDSDLPCPGPVTTDNVQTDA
jgi:hypothetical protein